MYPTYRYIFAKRLEQQPIEYPLVLKAHQLVAIYSRSFVSVKSDHMTGLGQSVAVGKQHSLRVMSERNQSFFLVLYWSAFHWFYKDPLSRSYAGCVWKTLQL